MTSGDWNAAIEAAAKVAEECNYTTVGDGYFDPYGSRQEAIVAEIRALTRQPTTPTTGEDDVERLFDADGKMNPVAAGVNLTLHVRVGYPGSRMSDLLMGDSIVPAPNSAIRAALAAISPTTEDAEKRELVEARWHWLLESKEAEAIVPSRKSRLSLISGMVRAENEMKQALASIGERS